MHITDQKNPTNITFKSFLNNMGIMQMSFEISDFLAGLSPKCFKILTMPLGKRLVNSIKMYEKTVAKVI